MGPNSPTHSDYTADRPEAPGERTLNVAFIQSSTVRKFLEAARMRGVTPAGLNVSG
jgi:hypothetical protein